MIEPHMYAQKNVVVLGLGRSGKSVAQSLQKAGACVLAWDDVENARESALESGIPICDPEALDWSKIHALILSPGIPHLYPAPHPLVAIARGHGIAPISDIELLFQSGTGAFFVGITGTNGKSTTTALIHHILNSASRQAEIGGNFGIPVLDLKPLGSQGTYVLEMSSYQLEISPSQHFGVSVFLNLAPDHLDRHGGIRGYLEAKKKIYENSTPEDVLVLGVDDPYTDELYCDLLKEGRVKVIPVSVHKSLSSGVYVEDGFLIDNCEGLKKSIVNLKDLKTLKGVHNWQNAACAYAALKSQGLLVGEIISGLQSFPGLAHRQERIAEVNGVIFVNDSKATNAEATSKALDCYQDLAIYWLLGGRAKEGGIESLASYFPQIEHAFLFGESSSSFALTLEGRVSFTQCGDLSTAFEKASRQAKEDKKKASVVLLSPACASFDQFRDFEARGEAFRTLVQNLIKEEHVKVA
ncbi:UDP-N-acetylmuramoylalanine--D-glutamate ligase [Candidatus Bealeia paramacronuclearis]|uniref:UDP-N-acetylmuramoylalanine--D-glutamate ligase n=1 Tax=Candidatus Bealeia paramacronuclearis TaxID=1921001 RepID=A0ABZ2C2P1_9PROT|nr:UDP-N-acetylmuramoylalanine--D-glutamate ligase [Candidatus Bealeia paramacronuclearis]